MKYKIMMWICILFLLAFAVFGDNLARDKSVACNRNSRAGCIVITNGINVTNNVGWDTQSAGFTGIGSAFYIIIDLEDTYTITEVNVSIPECNAANIGSANYWLMYSDDNSSWTYVDAKNIVADECESSKSYAYPSFLFDVESFDARYVKVNMTPTVEHAYVTEILIEGEPPVSNNAPNNPTSVTLVSVDGSNKVYSDLNCNGTVTDDDEDKLNITFSYFKDGVHQFDVEDNSNYASGSTVYNILDNNNLTIGDYWNCSIRSYDGQEYSDFVNSSSVLIADYDKTVWINLSNRTSSDIGSSLVVFEPFFVNINYSIEDEPDTESSCTWNTSSISAYFFYDYGNYTLNSSQGLSVFIDESSNNVLYDVMNGRVCRENAVKDLFVYVNGTLAYNVSGVEIPLCSVGFHENTINFTSQNSNDYINATIICPACTVANGLRLITDSRNHTFYYERVFSEHSEEATFNVSNNKYVYYNHYYNFDNSGINYISASCNDSQYNNTIGFSVIGQPITSYLTEIVLSGTSISFTDNVSFQERYNITIIGDCRDDLTSVELMNVSYLNGTVISSNLDEFLNLDVSSLPINTTYNVSLYCKSVHDEENMTSRYFFLDEIPKNVVITSPFDSQINTSNPLYVFFNFSFLPTYCGLWGNSSGTMSLLDYEYSSATTYYNTFNFTSNDFDDGSYSDVFKSNNKLTTVNGSASGVYTSDIYDFERPTQFYNLSYWLNIAPNRQLNDDKNNDSGSFVSNIYMDNNKGLYHFNETEGTSLTDSSGEGNTGTLTGGTFTDGVFGNAIDLDGINDYAEFGDNADYEYNQAFSVGMWIKASENSENIDYIVAKLVYSPSLLGWVLFHSDTSGLNIQLRNDGNYIHVINNTNILDDEWHFLMFTYDGSSDASGLTLYIDGTNKILSQENNNLSTNSILNNENLTIGRRNDGQKFLNGSVDEFFYFDDELSSAEVKNIYRRTVRSKINFSIRTCNDGACSGESYSEYEGDSTIDISDLDVNRYLQFKINFYNDLNYNMGLELFNITSVYNTSLTGENYLIGEIYNFSETFAFNTESTIQYFMSCNFSESVVVNSTPILVYYNNTDDNRPVVNITHVNDNLFSPNITLELTNFTFNTTCVGDDDISAVYMNISYSNGTLAYSGSVSSNPYVNFTVSNLYFGADDNYTVSIACKDNDEQWDSFYRNMQILDRVYPRIISNVPDEDNTSIVYYNGTLDIDINVYDLNLFSVQVQCYDNLSVIIQDFYIENLTVLSYQFQNSTNALTNIGMGICNITGQDWHTKKSIKDEDLKPRSEGNILKFTKDRKKFVFNYTNIEVYGFIIDKDDDRYTFYPDTDIKKLPSRITHVVGCENDILYYKYDDEYGHTFSCGKMWYDPYMEGIEDEDDYSITMINDNKAIIDVRLKSINNLTQLKSKSVGVKNINTKILEFEVIQQIQNPFENLSTVQVLIYGLFVLIWLVLMVVGLFFGIPMLVLVSGILGIFIGVLFIPLNTIIALIIIMMNVMVGIFAVLFGAK